MKELYLFLDYQLHGIILSFQQSTFDNFVDKKSFLIILKVSMISFLLAIIIDLLNYDKKLWGLLSLYMPLYIVGLYRFLRFIFVSIKKREPIDTAFDLKGITPWSDRLFNIFFFCMATIIPMIVLGLKSIHR